MSLWLIKEIHALYHHHVSITKEINEAATIQIMTTYIVALANSFVLRIEITITCWTIESYHFLWFSMIINLTHQRSFAAAIIS